MPIRSDPLVFAHLRGELCTYLRAKGLVGRLGIVVVHPAPTSPSFPSNASLLRCTYLIQSWEIFPASGLLCFAANAT